jgi:exodeoxyribonuclease-3
MRLATWNVNSIRTRVDRVADWLERADVDVLAMQETKCADGQFPTMPFAALGYDVVHSGVNQWNGVAIASRIGIEDVAVNFDGQPTWSDKPEMPAAAEARALGATCGGVRVWSLYVPNGRSVDSRHYTYKLEWLAALRNTASSWLQSTPAAPIALVGDWNIAPFDDDVWDISLFQESTHVTEPERAAFNAIVDAGFTDVVRPFTPGPGTFTYWDYTQLRFPKNRGMRIDFILGSPALAARVTHAEIARDERKTGKNRVGTPSDHAPVVVDIAAG